MTLNMEWNCVLSRSQIFFVSGSVSVSASVSGFEGDDVYCLELKKSRPNDVT